MALQMGGGAMPMAMSGGAMPMQMMPQQAMPNFAPPAGAAPASSGGVAPGAADVNKRRGEDPLLRDGAAACLTLEVHGACVRAAYWDGRGAKALPFDTAKKGECPATLAIEDAAQFAAWTKKKPSRRAAEPHLAGARVGARGKTEILAPGAFLGAHDGLQATKTVETDFGNITEACYAVEGEKVTPALAVALLCAKPRQRATQLVERPVRRATVVAPASAGAAWRLALCRALEAVDCAAASIVGAPLAALVGKALRDPQAFGAADAASLTGRVVCVDVGSLGVDCAVVDVDDGCFRTVSVAGDPMPKERAALINAALGARGKENDKVLIKAETAARAVIKAALAAVAAEALEVPTHFLVRGEASLAQAALKACASLATKDAPVVEAEEADAVLGAAALTAAELGLDKAPEISFKGMLAASLGLAPLVAGTPDATQQEALFRANEPLPCSARRAYVRKDLLKDRQLTDDAELSWAFVEDGRCLREGCYDPFETVDDDDEITHAEKCHVEFTVDARGIPVARVLAAAVPKNAEKLKRKAEEKRCHSYLKIFLTAFVALPGSLTLYHMGKRRITRGKTVVILEEFYSRAQPDKVANAGSIADKYEGFEELLYKRLERQYLSVPGGPHVVWRAGPPFPVAAEEEEDVVDLDQKEL
jgi:hypothetical protein